MIDLPALPTDSLYKLLALSGIFLILITIYLIYNLYLKLKSKVYDIYSEQEVREAEISYLERMENPDPEEVLKVRIKHNLTAVKVKERNWYIKQLWVLSIFGTMIILIGIVMTYKGFTLWYSKVQVYQDRLLKLQVEQIEKEVNKQIHSNTDQQ